MRILVNMSVLVKGGSIQVANAFILEALRTTDLHTWKFAVSRKVFSEVSSSCPQAANDFEVFDESPARSKKSRNRLLGIESDFQPDCVFTLAGPAYVSFRAPHLLGFTNPWVTHSSWYSYKTLSFPGEWMWIFADSIYKGHCFRKADGWVTQSETARQGLHKRCFIPLEKIAVISNTCGPLFHRNQQETVFPEGKKKVRLLSFTAPYKHKCLALLPKIVKEILAREPNLDFEFVVTLPEDEPILKSLMETAKKEKVSRFITNQGPISLEHAPPLYQECDVCFLPTVLETFSATYPESMAMGLPIVTTDLSFIRDVCGDAALYFPPNDVSAAAQAILNLLADRELWESLVARGKKVLGTFPTPHEKFELFMEAFGNLVAGRPVSA